MRNVTVEIDDDVLSVTTGISTGAVDGATTSLPGDPVTLPFGAALDKSSEPEGSAPRAYLNWIFFNKNLVMKNGGYRRISEKAKEDGTNVEHERLADSLVITEPGYLYVFLSNEEAQPTEVIFDDLTISVDEGPVIQVNDYYPYGMTAYTLVREGEEEVKEKFQGKEYNDKTGLHDFHARQYDAALGRWFAVDPAGQFVSPYLAMGNNPVVMIDPDGRWVNIVIGAVVGGVSSYISARHAGARGTELFGYTMFGTIIGATAAAVGGEVGGYVGAVTSSAWIGAVAGGAAAGAVSGGYTSAMYGGDFGQGAWRGAVIGAVGAGVGAIGGGESFGANLAYGIGEGAATGALGAALYGTDIGQGALYGGIAGGIFTTVSSPHFKNALRGRGFRSNSKVLADFVAAGNHQGALEYFGFEGTYDPYIKSKNYQSDDYWGATDKATGEITYGDLAFENYPTLYGTYIKERYTSLNIKSGRGIAQLPAEFQGLGTDTFLEEINGYVHAFKRQGLFTGHNLPFNGINYYQTQLDYYGLSYPKYPRSFIYRIPRRY